MRNGRVMLSVDAWEAIAVPSQAALIEFTREYVLGADYRDGPVEPDPMDVTHKYKPGARMFGDVVKADNVVQR